MRPAQRFQPLDQARDGRRREVQLLAVVELDPLAVSLNLAGDASDVDIVSGVENPAHALRGEGAVRQALDLGVLASARSVEIELWQVDAPELAQAGFLEALTQLW